MGCPAWSKRWSPKPRDALQRRGCGWWPTTRRMIGVWVRSTVAVSALLRSYGDRDEVGQGCRDGIVWSATLSALFPAVLRDWRGFSCRDAGRAGCSHRGSGRTLASVVESTTATNRPPPPPARLRLRVVCPCPV